MSAPTATKIPSEALSILLARSAVYQALALLLRHPDEETARWLAGDEPRKLAEVAEFFQAGLAGAARRLIEALRAASLEEWTAQHERVFGHSVHSAAPPYELEYGQPHSHRQPQELGDICAFYQAFGLQVSRLSHERADHIAAECEFMAFLLYKEALALDEGQEERAQLSREAARQFLADHLGRWGSAFASRLSRAAEGSLLELTANLTLAWLVGECARMGVSTGSHDLPLRLPQEETPGCAACSNDQEKSG
ncbi:MAG: molecular chaperone TorD family protein [Candidatus Omnitrophica bacterium]|nr:molecular chaperone TorD family protein [Candidatus Omnitrophota bacterium]